MVVFFATYLMAYAQQSRFPTRQEMQDYLNDVKTNTSEYDSQLDEIKSRNTHGGEVHTFLRIKSEIDSLDVRINREINNITASHNRDNRVSALVVSSLENMINQRKGKQEELEDLIANMQQ